MSNLPLPGRILQDTSTADGAFSHAFKAYQLPIFSNDISACDQNHKKKHHLPSSIAYVFQVPCSMARTNIFCLVVLSQVF